jgi:hypothetical protein
MQRRQHEPAFATSFDIGAPATEQRRGVEVSDRRRVSQLALNTADGPMRVVV